MLVFFTLTLAVAIAGLVALIALKRWELSTGRMFLHGARPAVSKALRRFGAFAFERLPERGREFARRGAERAFAGMHRLAAWCVLAFERLLERTLHVVRRKTDAPRGEGAASDFLREVAEHKRRLQKRSLKNRSIFEE